MKNNINIIPIKDRHFPVIVLNGYEHWLQDQFKYNMMLKLFLSEVYIRTMNMFHWVS